MKIIIKCSIIRSVDISKATTQKSKKQYPFHKNCINHLIFGQKLAYNLMTKGGSLMKYFE